jgi:uncharacterized protein
MKTSSRISFCFSVILALGSVTNVLASVTTPVEFETVGGPLYPGATVPARVPATLRLPAGDGPFPAMVIVHGTGGVHSNGEALAKVLLDAGIASIEPDMWKPRGLSGGTASRPRIISDTLPDAYGALVFLAANPKIDPKRIGIVGFSWGGAVSWITAFGLKPLNTGTKLDSLQFAVHVPFYPSCMGYLPDAAGGKALAALGVKPTGTPMMLVMGTKDDLETDATTCQQLQKSYPEIPMRLRMVEGATHTFDGESPGRYYENLARGGKGAWINIVPNPTAAASVRKEVAEFLREVFKMGAR